MISIKEVHSSRALHPSTYRDIDHLKPLLDQLSEIGRKTSAILGEHRVWMLSSTLSGGGVAEMLQRVCSLLAEFGIDARWIVPELDDPTFFQVTKAVHNMLHGVPGIANIAAAKTIYDRVNEEIAGQLRHIAPHDVLVVHDPQPAGVAIFLTPELRPRLIWRSHIGVPETNEHTIAGWDFLRPYLVPYERLLFSAASYIPREYLNKAGVLHPGIDPLSHKNRPLRPHKLIGLLHAAGLIEGPPVPDWARLQKTALRFVDGVWEARPIPNLLYSPIVLQVSRFDRLKGFRHLISSFSTLVKNHPSLITRKRVESERASYEVESACLVLAGPDPAGVVDDPEAGEVLAELCAQHAALPGELRARVHLLRLPMENAKENSLIVNALQTIAAVVVQNSLQEGFGLTVAEALWKAAPFVGSNVGGISVQVRHGIDGLLVDDPTDHESLGAAIVSLLATPLEAENMGRSGRSRVREHFLMFTQVRKWLIELDRLLSRPEPVRVLARESAADTSHAFSA